MRNTFFSPTDTSQSVVMSGRSSFIACFLFSSHSNVVSLLNPCCLRIVLVVLYFRFEVIQDFVYLFSAVAQLVQALSYKPQGRGLDSQCRTKALMSTHPQTEMITRVSPEG